MPRDRPALNLAQAHYRQFATSMLATLSPINIIQLWQSACRQQQSEVEVTILGCLKLKTKPSYFSASRCVASVKGSLKEPSKTQG